MEATIVKTVRMRNEGYGETLLTAESVEYKTDGMVVKFTRDYEKLIVMANLAAESGVIQFELPFAVFRELVEQEDEELW